MKRTILSAAISLILASGMQAQSMNTVLQQIEQNNMELRALHADRHAATEEAASRLLPSAPSVEYSPFFMGNVNGVASSEMIVRQEFDFPTQYVQKKRTARGEEQTLDAQYRVARREVLWQAQALCIDLIQVQQNHTLLQERHRISQDLRTLYEKKLAAGDATMLDMNKIRLECITRQTELEENEVIRQTLISQLQTLNGGHPLTLDSLHYPESHPHIAIEDMVRQRRQTDVELLALQQQEKLATQHVTEARQSWLPRLSLGYRRNTAEDLASNGFLVGVSFPVLSTKRQVNAAQARRDAIQLRTQQTCIQMENQLQALATQYRQHLRSMASYDLSLLRSSLTLLQRAVESGEVDVIDYYTEAERIYAQWQTYLSLEHDCHRIHAEIHRNDL